MVQVCDTVKTLPRRKRLQPNWLQRTWSRFGYYLFSPSRRRPGPMLPQAPEFDRFLRPCPIGQPHAGYTMGPGLRRDGVICSEGAMQANWITASKAGAHPSSARQADKWIPAFAGKAIRWRFYQELAPGSNRGRVGRPAGGQLAMTAPIHAENCNALVASGRARTSRGCSIDRTVWAAGGMLAALAFRYRTATASAARVIGGASRCSRRVSRTATTASPRARPHQRPTAP
jgi:hypothetical protein